MRSSEFYEDCFDGRALPDNALATLALAAAVKEAAQLVADAVRGDRTPDEGPELRKRLIAELRDRGESGTVTFASMTPVAGEAPPDAPEESSRAGDAAYAFAAAEFRRGWNEGRADLQDTPHPQHADMGALIGYEHQSRIGARWLGYGIFHSTECDPELCNALYVRRHTQERS